MILNGGIALFAGINLYQGNEKFYEEIAMPMFQVLGAETAHNLGVKLAKYGIVPRSKQADSPCLVSILTHNKSIITFSFLLSVICWSKRCKLHCMVTNTFYINYVSIRGLKNM